MNRKTGIIRILLHGLFLVSTNLFSVMVAFVSVKLLSLPSEGLVQGGLALGFNLGIYFVVYKVMSGIQKELMSLDNFSMLVTVLFVSLALLPAVFYPLHYLTHGYWSTFDNLLATWPFQIVVNGLCLVMNYFIFYRRKK